MNTTQSRIIELLREVHVLASNEIERLSALVVELEAKLNSTTSTTMANRHVPNDSEGLLNDVRVAKYLNVSLASVRNWRSSGRGPQFVKIGSSVRYRRGDVEAWIDTQLEARSKESGSTRRR